MMNICFATDDNYVKPTAIAIMTVLLTNKGRRNLDLYFSTVITRA